VMLASISTSVTPCASAEVKGSKISIAPLDPGRKPLSPLRQRDNGLTMGTGRAVAKRNRSLSSASCKILGYRVATGRSTVNEP
jgi:hypothetical protein